MDVPIAVAFVYDLAAPDAAVKSLCRALLVLNVLYCALAAAQEGLPGWHMFESVQLVDSELRDRDGRLLDLRALLPRGANVVDPRELRDVAVFACRREPARAPFTYTERARHVDATLGDDCILHVSR